MQLSKILRDYFQAKNNIDTYIKDHRLILKFQGNSYCLTLYNLSTEKQELLIENIQYNPDGINLGIKLTLQKLEKP